jgi:hypothetical protein
MATADDPDVFITLPPLFTIHTNGLGIKKFLLFSGLFSSPPRLAHSTKKLMTEK